MAYDAFISYSHSADDAVAPRLQAGLHRFAKPWWQRQTVRVFRDEGSLAANPHLWSSIVEALDDSEWMMATSATTITLTGRERSASTRRERRRLLLM